MMFFMDVLELDLVNDGRFVDLDLGNMEWEIVKVYMVFFLSLDGIIFEIKIGLWGCGVFCGDLEVKMLLLWFVLLMVGVNFMVVCDYEL